MAQYEDPLAPQPIEDLPEEDDPGTPDIIPDQSEDMTPNPENVPEQDSPTPSYFVRRRPRATAEPIDNLAEEDKGLDEAVNDSNYTAPGGSFASSSYRRSRAGRNRLRRDLHYGQYLEVPKGRRDIFVAQERKMHIKTFIALVFVLALLFLAVVIVWNYMNTNWGAASF